MKIAIYSRIAQQEITFLIDKIIDMLSVSGDSCMVNLDIKDTLDVKILNSSPDFYYKSRNDIINAGVDYFVSIGGDGTFLDTLLFVADTDIPVMGINAGKLGFLATTQLEEIEKAFQMLRKKDFLLESRSVLELKSIPPVFRKKNYALNDLTIHKRDNSSLTSISTYLNGEFFNTYWGDGIIVSTPTGSTAYSLSCGGPIVFPDSNTFVITPVAPHNLNVRPVIVPDDVEISFEINEEEKKYIVSLDSRYKVIDSLYKISVKKADFQFKTIKFSDKGFSKILREKLNWGIDKRNI